MKTEKNYINKEKIDWKDQIVEKPLSEKIFTADCVFNHFTGKNFPIVMVEDVAEAVERLKKILKDWEGSDFEITEDIINRIFGDLGKQEGKSKEQIEYENGEYDDYV